RCSLLVLGIQLVMAAASIIKDHIRPLARVPIAGQNQAGVVAAGIALMRLERELAQDAGHVIADRAMALSWSGHFHDPPTNQLKVTRPILRPLAPVKEFLG